MKIKVVCSSCEASFDEVTGSDYEDALKRAAGDLGWVIPGCYGGTEYQKVWGICYECHSSGVRR